MPYQFLMILVTSIIWMVPFFLRKPGPRTPLKRDPRARWGILIQSAAYALIWQGNFWTRSPAPWRLILSAPLLAVACLISWTAVRALGRQWRFDAGVNEDHELVRSGPYRIVRHPIYTSMMCLFLGTGLLITRLPLLLLSFALLILGTEIRVRTEDRLLESHFGEALREYRREVPAYIPFMRRRRPANENVRN
jgi:protein-S-isoprenylcysteine O-methyltransferase Ste14